MSGKMVPPQDFPSDRGLVRSAHAPARGGCQRARSFNSRITVSRPNAVGRDGVVNLFAFCKFCPFLLNADSWQPKNYASNQPRAFAMQTVRGFHTRYFWFSRGTPLPTQHFLCRAAKRARNNTGCHLKKRSILCNVFPCKNFRDTSLEIV